MVALLVNKPTKWCRACLHRIPSSCENHALSYQHWTSSITSLQWIQNAEQIYFEIFMLPRFSSLYTNFQVFAHFALPFHKW